MSDGLEREMYVVLVFDQSRASLITTRFSLKCYAVAERAHGRHKKRTLNWAGAQLDDLSRAFVHRRARRRLKGATSE